jgi:ubiquinone biosynthesis protein
MLDPKINMWDVSGPFVREWIRDELGPEAALADGLREQGKTLALIPDIIRRLDAQLPKPGGAPPAPPLPDVALMWEKGERRVWWRYAAVAVLAAAASAAAMWAIL